jgi:hypothetical protein
VHNTDLISRRGNTAIRSFDTSRRIIDVNLLLTGVTLHPVFPPGIGQVADLQQLPDYKYHSVRFTTSEYFTGDIHLTAQICHKTRHA